jgi:hypothetical protein
VPILSTLGALLGVMDGDVGRCLLAAAHGHLPTAWGKAKLGRLVAGGVLGDDVVQLLRGVPKNVV